MKHRKGERKHDVNAADAARPSARKGKRHPKAWLRSIQSMPFGQKLLGIAAILLVLFMWQYDFVLTQVKAIGTGIGNISKTEMEFEDSSFDTVYRRTYGLRDRDKIYREDVEGQLVLRLIGNESDAALSLVDLQSFTSLSDLYLNRLELEVDQDLSQLAPGLTITSLSIRQMGLDNLHGIEELPLEQLTIVNAGITALPPFIGELDTLQLLELSNNRLTQVASLFELPELESLNLSHNRITALELDSVRSEQPLVSLNLAENPLRTVSGADVLDGLEQLNLAGTRLEDLDFLPEIPSIRILDLSGTRNDLDPLADMPELAALRLDRVRQVDIDLGTIETLHSIYVSDHFDRTQLDFMVGNFYQADPQSRAYFIREKYGIR